jgi:hypothetical protein
VRIRNSSSSEVYLVGSLDGSDMGWRYPKCGFEVFGPDGSPVVHEGALCDVTNGIGVVDFVKVPAEGSFDPLTEGFFIPYQLIRFPAETPGIYTVRFYYSTATDDIQDYQGGQRGRRPSQEVQRLFERVPKLDLESNDLKLTFVASGPSR